MTDADRTIHLSGTILEDTVKMNARTLIAQLVINIDDHTIALGNIQQWQRPLPIDADGRAVEGSVRVGSDPSNVPIIIDSSSLRYQAKWK